MMYRDFFPAGRRENEEQPELELSGLVQGGAGGYHPVAARFLGFVQGLVGFPQGVLPGGAVLREKGDAEGQGDFSQF